jgi:hypothetical protein
MRINKSNGSIIILLCAINLLSGKPIDNFYFDFKYGVPILKWPSYEVIDSSGLYLGGRTRRGPLLPSPINFTAGYIFSKPNISLISLQQFAFETPSTKDVNYLNYSIFLGLGKIITVYSSLLNLYGLIGYSWDNLLLNFANSAKIIAGYPAFFIGSDFYYKFIPFTDFVFTYRFGITTAKTYLTQKDDYLCKYIPLKFKNEIDIGFSFGKIRKMH